MSVKFSDKDEEMVHGKNEFPEEGDSGGDNKYSCKVKLKIMKTILK